MYQDSFSDGRMRVAALFLPGGIVLAILAVLLAFAGSSPVTPEEVAAELAATPGLAEPLGMLHRHYPDEYRDMLARLTAAGRQRGREGMTREGYYFMRGFMTTKADAMTRAPDALLDRLADDYLAMMETLAHLDARACAEATMTGLAVETHVPPRAATAIGRIATQQIRIARAGENGALPLRAPPSQADLQAWRERIEAIDPGSAVLFERDAVALAPPERQCRAGIVLFRAITELPPETSATIMAHLLRQPAEERPRPPPRPTI